MLTRVPPSPPTIIDLASSVTNVAETFVHQELDPVENRVLRESIHHSRTATKPKPTDERTDFRLPGGLDPFMIEDDSEEGLYDMGEAEEVSFLTSLTDSLLSRLRISILNTSVTVIHDDHSEFLVEIPEMHFGTEDVHDNYPPAPTSTDGEQDSDTPKPAVRIAVARTFHLSGLSFAMRDLTQSRPSTILSNHHHTYDLPDESDESSSDDEIAQAHMTHSTLSVRSSASMYHSALSLSTPPISASTRTIPSGPQLSFKPAIPTKILSIKEPVIVQITSHPSASYRPTSSAPPRPKVVIKATVGVVAAALDSWHLRAILDSMQFIPEPVPSPPPTSLSTIPRAPTIKDTLMASVQIRAVAILLLGTPNNLAVDWSLNSTPEPINKFYEKPLAPYSHKGGFHIRLQLDQFDATFSRKLAVPVAPALVSELDASLSDLFIVYLNSKSFIPTDTNDEVSSETSVSPILIFDPYLSNVPNVARMNAFPFMDVASDWERRGATVRPSAWRIRAPQPPRRDVPAASSFAQEAIASSGGAISGDKRPAVTVQYSSVQEEQGGMGETTLLPVHFFIDLEMISNFMIPFADGLTPNLLPEEDMGDDDDTGSIGSIGSDEVYDPEHANPAVMETPRPRKAELEPEHPDTYAYAGDKKAASSSVCNDFRYPTRSLMPITVLR